VSLGEETVGVPAVLTDESTWGGVRAQVTLCGGSVPAAGSDPIVVTVTVCSTDHALQGRLFESVGIGNFRELIALSGRGFGFDLDRRRLDSP